MLKSVSQPLPYTSSPLKLALSDLWLFLRITFTWPVTNGLPSIVLPFYPFKSGSLDELYPSLPNLWAIGLHLLLVVVQGAFILVLVPSILLGVPVPLLGWTPTCLIIIVGFVVGNNYFCTLLNGTERRFESYVDQSWEKHDDERWIFVNGVAAGSHWMQSNLDRLALTFRRPVHGIHNKTRGIIFDVIETIIQRTFGYATPDIREVYADIVKVIEDEQGKTARYKKIVLVLHSQGAVEGGLVLDWLFAAVSRELLQKLEVYTFGSAANHFNSPEFEDGTRVIQHIEHYANLGDYVSLFGILHFRPLPLKAQHQPGQIQEKIVNRYVGRLFTRAGSGHQMNGNYLDNFFEMDLDKNGRPNKVKENNEYMDGVLNEELLEGYQIIGKVSERDVWDCSGQRERTERADGMARMIKDESRLWRYRNGMSPSD